MSIVLTKEQKEKIEKCIVWEGKTYQETADICNLTHTYIRRYASSNNLKPIYQNKEWLQNQYDMYIHTNIIAEKYKNLLEKEFITPYVPQGFISSWAQYTIILDNLEQREKIQARLKEKGIPTMIYYPIPMHKQTAFSGYNFNVDDLKEAENLCDRVLSIPMHPYLDNETIEFIANSLIESK